MNEKKIVHILKKNLARLRKERGISQRALAREIGVSQRMVAYYEDKAIDIPLSKVEDLAEALNVSIGELLDIRVQKQTEHIEIDVRILRKIRQIQDLPKRARESLLQTINTALEMNKIKSKVKNKIDDHNSADDL